MQVVWFKRDLRTVDHLGLEQAITRSPTLGAVMAVYVHEPAWLAQPYVSALHQQFVCDSLDSLHRSFEDVGGVFNELVGDVVEQFELLWQRTQFSTLWSYEEVTTLWGFERDKAVARWCASKNVSWNQLKQNGVHRGGPQAHNRFDFRAHLNHSCFTALSSLKNLAIEGLGASPALFIPEVLVGVPSGSISRNERPTGPGPVAPEAARGGMEEAETFLLRFFQLNKLLNYPRSISSPNSAWTGCSRLSAFLAYGVVSDRYLMQRLNAVVEDNLPLLNEEHRTRLLDCAQFFAERLYWRSAYAQKMEMHPISEAFCDLPQFEGLREAEELQGHFEAWCNGQTGVPMVDAAMRNLNQTGWIPMRMRGMVASFALNELWLPWKKVGNYLAQHFTDFEPFIHFSQIQIHAGSSRLSGPLTYVPAKQQADQDPEGVYVRRWCPELKQVPAEYLAEPFKMPLSTQVQSACIIGENYPAPLVHATGAHEAAHARVSALRAGETPPTSAYWKQRSLQLQNQAQHALF